MTRGETMEKVIAILQGTEDGDKLSKPALKVVESAVNNRLNEYGLNLLDELYNMVMDGTYTAAKFKKAIKDTLPTE
jgi:precorrin-6x reductase